MTKARIETPSQVSLRRVAKRFLIIFLPLVILLGGILAVFYYQQAKNERTIIETEEVQHVSHQMDIVINDLQSILTCASGGIVVVVGGGIVVVVVGRVVASGGVVVVVVPHASRTSTMIISRTPIICVLRIL